jgi:hypothetical protein
LLVNEKIVGKKYPKKTKIGTIEGFSRCLRT